MNTVLTAADWSLLETVFHAALEIPASERAAYLDAACHNHREIRLRIESLLRSEATSHSLISPLLEEQAVEFEAACVPAEGDSIGPYKIVKLLGRGGMGVVFQAIRCDDVYKKIVAIKLSAFALPTRDLAAQFQRERQILASLDHPYIAMLLDGGAMPNGTPYFVMEYVDGQPIDRYCDEHQLNIRRRLELFLQVAEAVQYAHRNLVVHRDLKPGNILITSSGNPKLLDFGIAKLLAPDVPTDGMPRTLEIMTPEYASPEQIRGEFTGTGTDVYQLGIILYELLTGVRPFRKDTNTPGKLERDICESVPARPKINPDIDRVILKALEKDQAARYLSVADFASDIERYMAGFPVLARAPSWRVTASKFVQRNSGSVSAAAIFLLLLLGLGISMAVLAKRAAEQARASTQVTDFLTQLFDSNDPTQSQGDTLTARELLDRGASRIQTSLREDPLIQARLLDTIGRLYDTLGARPQAADLLNKSLALRQHRLPRDDWATANTLHELGSVLAELGKTDQARDALQQALKLYRSQGENSVQTGSALDDLAVVLFQSGETGKAEQMMRQSIDINVKVGGTTSRDSLRAMNNLVFMLNQRGDYTDAEPLARQVLTASAATQGPYSEAVGAALMNLSAILTSLGEYQEAEATLRNAIGVKTKAVGKAHPNTIFSTLALASLLTRTGRIEEAEKLSSVAFKQAQSSSGEQDGCLDYAREVLAFVRLAQGRGEEARTLLHTMFEHSAKTALPSSAVMATNWNDLGIVDQALLSLPSAASEFGRALTMRRNRFGQESTIAAGSETRMAAALSEMGDDTRAKPLAEHALKIDRAAYPKGHVAIGDAEMTLGWIECRMRQVDSALSLLKDSYAIAVRVYPAQAPATAQTAIRFAACLGSISDERAKGIIAAQGPALDRSPDPSFHMERHLLQLLRKNDSDALSASIHGGAQVHVK